VTSQLAKPVFDTVVQTSLSAGAYMQVTPQARYFLHATTSVGCVLPMAGRDSVHAAHGETSYDMRLVGMSTLHSKQT